MVRCLDLNIHYTFRDHLIILLFFLRFITNLYYLNEVDKGGQTAVLMADNITITPDVSNLNEL